MLHDGDDDLARLVERLVVGPAGITRAQLGGDAIVLAQEERLQRGQSEILVGAALARRETLHGRVRVAARSVLRGR